ncbi:MAG TPA: DCC1-like thiol-disulfide oxidoreductase family protein [Bryobacteraceae bacterium]|nr:DCC1-like thiol-disulfide oxidoreductase family protein [Bryobacteraceae bacterium]
MGRIVVWDDGCAFCRAWVERARRLDWLRAHEFIGASEPEAYDGTGLTREQTAEAMQLVWPGGRASGFDAVRRILLRLPLTALPALLLWLPPVIWLGPMMYRRVAARRHCLYTPGRGQAQS